MRSLWLSILLLGLVARTARAQSALDTCVRVEGSTDVAAFERLVRSELDRHPSHRVSSPPCQSELLVERIQLEGHVYLTGRLVGQVPHRVRVDGGRVDRALHELLRVVLGNDPWVLRDPAKGDWFGRAMFGLRHRGHSLWGLDVGERMAALKGHFQALPEVGLHYRRELDAWQLGLRFAVAARLDSEPEHVHVTWHASLIPELSWFSSASANTAAFVSAGIGLSHQRVGGPRGKASATGLVAVARAGVELFRTTTTRVQLHADATLPAFVVDERDVFRAWLPTFGVGSGIAF